jgi:hypothetical protein
MEADAKRPEAWVALAWLVLAAEIALAVYLGLKRPGAGPVRAYLFGPPILVGAALLVAALGIARSFARKPFARPQRMVALCLLAIVAATASAPIPFPSYRADRPSLVRFRSPFRGEWTVAWGGPDAEANFLARARADRRFGYDFVVVKEGRTRSASDPASAFAFGEDVLAPCEGLVARVRDGIADDGASAPDDLGNFVAIEAAPGEFLFLASLQRGSIAVREGERVAAGQPVARAGFSAASRITPEPHLALHLQDTPEPILGQGIPFYFHGVVVNDAALERVAPQGRGFFAGAAPTGDRVRVP